MFNCCSSTYDEKTLHCLLKEAQAAASKACEAVRIAETDAKRACAYAKAAEEAACRAERALCAAQEAQQCAEKAVEKISCLLNEWNCNRVAPCRTKDCDCGCDTCDHGHSHDYC